MCFSASASFAGGAIITAIGVMTVRTNRDPSRRLFAAIPLIFGVQQISEGFVWVALQSPGYDLMLSISKYIFLIAALVDLAIRFTTVSAGHGKSEEQKAGDLSLSYCGPADVGLLCPEPVGQRCRPQNYKSSH